MTIIYPINGKNERLGELFKTPKHLLLYKGMPAVMASIEYMAKRFGGEIRVLVGWHIEWRPPDNVKGFLVCPTKSQVETLNLSKISGPVMFIDCDIVPLEINEPKGNTVYLFENKEWMKQYSNYKVEDGKVIDCNEKGEFYPYAGAGIYYFENAADFYSNSEGCTSISQVVKKLPFKADTTSKIFRFGTLNDIKNEPI